RQEIGSALSRSSGSGGDARTPRAISSSSATERNDRDALQSNTPATAKTISAAAGEETVSARKTAIPSMPKPLIPSARDRKSWHSLQRGASGPPEWCAQQSRPHDVQAPVASRSQT